MCDVEGVLLLCCANAAPALHPSPPDATVWEQRSTHTMFQRSQVMAVAHAAWPPTHAPLRRDAPGHCRVEGWSDVPFFGAVLFRPDPWRTTLCHCITSWSLSLALLFCLPFPPLKVISNNRRPPRIPLVLDFLLAPSVCYCSYSGYIFLIPYTYIHP
ncbi:hypothetical protein B0J18DRAFT_205465 [Chaetomium sp. MPI-SDFR-AT-0129]|nr:hypothetical protein B0J18DRAFT_205465 [Chaetomium sp. MPI-SDFR-AT-0129]